MTDFRNKYSFEHRYNEATKIRIKYPDRIPIIIENNSDLELDKYKYLVPNTLTVGQFMYVVRRRLKIDPVKSIYIFINNTLHLNSTVINTIYPVHKNADNFLYVTIKYENTFG